MHEGLLDRPARAVAQAQVTEGGHLLPLAPRHRRVAREVRRLAVVVRAVLPRLGLLHGELLQLARHPPLPRLAQVQGVLALGVLRIEVERGPRATRLAMRHLVAHAVEPRHGVLQADRGELDVVHEARHEQARALAPERVVRELERAQGAVVVLHRLGDDGGGHAVEVVVLQLEAGERAVGAEHRTEGEAALGPRAVPAELEGLQAAGLGPQREGEHLDPRRQEEIPAQVELRQGRLGKSCGQRRGGARAEVIPLEVQRAQCWRVAGYHPLGWGAPRPGGVTRVCSARGRPDEGAQRAAHDLVVAEQVAAHLEGAQRAPHALLVGRRGEHLGPCGGADLVVGEVELREARVAPEGRGEQRATLRRGEVGPW